MIFRIELIVVTQERCYEVNHFTRVFVASGLNNKSKCCLFQSSEKVVGLVVLPDVIPTQIWFHRMCTCNHHHQHKEQDPECI